MFLRCAALFCKHNQTTFVSALPKQIFQTDNVSVACDTEPTEHFYRFAGNGRSRSNIYTVRSYIMRKSILIILNTVALPAMASLAFAAEPLGDLAVGLSTLGMTLGIGIAALGCGLAQGIAIKSACEGMARNPEAGDKISQSLILGLAFIESLCIYALLINLILIFANPFI